MALQGLESPVFIGEIIQRDFCIAKDISLYKMPKSRQTSDLGGCLFGANNTIFHHYTFFALGAILVVIGTLFMYKKYDQDENSGLYLGAFWLFTGFLL